MSSGGYELVGEGDVLIKVPELKYKEALPHMQIIIHFGKLIPQTGEDATFLCGSLKPTSEIAGAVLGLLVLGVQTFFLKADGKRAIIMSYKHSTSEWVINGDHSMI